MASRTLTREENLKFLYNLFGDKFDYTKTDFKQARDIITYWCKNHQCYVTQKLMNHKLGQQCPQCAKESMVCKKSKSLDEFLPRAKEKFGNQYQYDSASFENMSKPMRILCVKHGWFVQTPSAHLRQGGCPECVKIASFGPRDYQRSNKQDILNRVSLVHPDFKELNFSEVPDKIRMDEKYDVQHITCGTWFFPTFNALLNNGHGGYSSCPVCSRLKKYQSFNGEGNATINIVECVKSTLGVAGYSFEKTIYVDMKTPWIITCLDHGDFECLPQNTLRGHGCPCCAIQSVAEQKTMSYNRFVELAQEKHDGNAFIYHRDSHISSQVPMHIECVICGEHFQQTPSNHLNGQGCPKCARGKTVSKWEKEIREFLLSNGISNLVYNDRTIIAPKEIDIYLPDYNIGIECDGIYWHTDKFGFNKRTHLDKTVMAEKSGVHLIHIFEDEWRDNRKICESIILNQLGKSHYYFGARECKIKPVSNDNTRRFLTLNHIQGYTVSSYSYGLYYTLNKKEYLVSLMTFGNDRFVGVNKLGEFELIRFCNKLGYSIPGAASKLFKHFIKKHNPSAIKSFCNRRYYTGITYQKIGMMLERTSIPNYFYVSRDNRESRQKYMKHKLVEKYGCPNEMSESDFCRSYLGLHRIYDCGNLVFYWRSAIITE